MQPQVEVHHSAPKRFPKPLDFTSHYPSHMSLILVASILRANTYGIPILGCPSILKRLEDIVEKVHIPVFKPKEGLKIVRNEKDTNVSPSTLYDDDDVEIIQKLVTTIESGVKNIPSGFHMNPTQFEMVFLILVSSLLVNLYYGVLTGPS